MLVKIKVIPKAAQNALAGWENDILKIRLRAVPEKGEANETLIAYLSKLLDIPKSRIHLVRGHHSRHKLLEIEGMTEDEFALLIANR